MKIGVTDKMTLEDREPVAHSKTGKRSFHKDQSLRSLREQSDRSLSERSERSFSDRRERSKKNV